jgi:hypothetical protein
MKTADDEPSSHGGQAAQDPNSSPDEPGAAPYDPVMPPAVVALLVKHAGVRRAFEGKGQTAIGPDGQPMAGTSAGYDFTFAMLLALQGVTAAADLAAAIWNRPDRAARAQGQLYVARVARDVLEQLERLNTAESASSVGVEGLDDLIDFKVGQVTVLSSDPPSFDLTIDGRSVRFSAKEMLSANAFKSRYFEALHRVPKLPFVDTQWAALVNRWISHANRISLPPEASTVGFQRECICSALVNMSEGETVEDLDRRQFLVRDKQIMFRTEAIRLLVKEGGCDLNSNTVCMHLRDLGYRSQTPWIDGTKTRVWTCPAPDETNEDPPSGGGE